MFTLFSVHLLLFVPSHNYRYCKCSTIHMTVLNHFRFSRASREFTKEYTQPLSSKRILSILNNFKHWLCYSQYLTVWPCFRRLFARIYHFYTSVYLYGTFCGALRAHLANNMFTRIPQTPICIPLHLISDWRRAASVARREPLLFTFLPSFLPSFH